MSQWLLPSLHPPRQAVVDPCLLHMQRITVSVSASGRPGDDVVAVRFRDSDRARMRMHRSKNGSCMS
jgi:hypothetical protein